MSNETIRRIHLIYGAVLSIVTVIAGICFIVQCLNIYHSGPYSRPVVAEHFVPIAIPIYLCLALVIGGFILKFALPMEQKRPKGAQTTMVLANLHRRRDLSQGEADTVAAVAKEQRLRRRNTTIAVALLIIGSVIFLSYGCNGANFGTDITAAMISAMWILLPCLAIPFAWAIFAAYQAEASRKREIELMRKVPAGTPAQADTSSEDKAVKIVRWVLVIVSVVILIYGFCTGGTADVLTKAINICTECIGLG